MPKRKKFITVNEFLEKEKARKSQDAAAAAIKKRESVMVTENLEYSSVAKVGVCEGFQDLNLGDSFPEETPYRIDPNPGLIKALLKHNNYEHWGKNIGGQQPYTLETLDETSEEYQQLTRMSKKIEITDIQKICNPYLLLQYELQKLKYQRCNYGGCIYDYKVLFHGTRRENVDKICSTNFDWRLAGSFTGTRFGRGVSFTQYTGYAMNYGDTSDEKVMLGVEVIVGGSCLGYENTVFPPGQYDTTVNEKQSVYVKYDDNAFYPAYLIHYREY